MWCRAPTLPHQRGRAIRVLPSRERVKELIPISISQFLIFLVFKEKKKYVNY
jgi:hypothetical protein